MKKLLSMAIVSSIVTVGSLYYVDAVLLVDSTIDLKKDGASEQQVNFIASLPKNYESLKINEVGNRALVMSNNLLYDLNLKSGINTLASSSNFVSSYEYIDETMYLFMSPNNGGVDIYLGDTVSKNKVKIGDLKNASEIRLVDSWRRDDLIDFCVYADGDMIIYTYNISKDKLSKSHTVKDSTQLLSVNGSFVHTSKAGDVFINNVKFKGTQNSKYKLLGAIEDKIYLLNLTNNSKVLEVLVEGKGVILNEIDMGTTKAGRFICTDDLYYIDTDKALGVKNKNSVEIPKNSKVLTILNNNLYIDLNNQIQKVSF